jgi:hypothetical protein
MKKRLMVIMVLGISGIVTAESPWESRRVSDNPNPRRMLGSAYLDGRVYCVAGETGSHYGYSTTVLSYNPSTDAWDDANIADAPTARSYNAVVAFNGEIWSIGGNNGDPVSTVEIYNPSSNIWRTGPSLLQARYEAGAATVGSRIYEVGGGSGYRPMEVFDPDTGSWAYPTHPEPSYAHLYGGSAASLGMNIFFLNDATERAGQVDIYDTVTGEWHAGPSINNTLIGTPGFGLHLFNLGEELYVLTDTPNTGQDPYLFWLNRPNANETLWYWQELGQFSELHGKGAYAVVPISDTEVLVTAGEFRPTQPSVDPPSWILTVPEPAMLSLLVLGVLALLRR